MIMYIFGLVSGLLLFYLIIVFKNYNERIKKGKRIDKYRKAPILSKLVDTIRHIVFEYNIKRKNNDFTLNIYLEKKLVFQILHRCHFPCLCVSEDDLAFGLALYIPLNQFNQYQKEKLLQLFKEETENFIYEEVPFDYYVIDLGKRVRHSSYLLTRIMDEVLLYSEVEKVSFKLFSEGEIPYFGIENHPEKS